MFVFVKLNIKNVQVNLLEISIMITLMTTVICEVNCFVLKGYCYVSILVLSFHQLVVLFSHLTPAICVSCNDGAILLVISGR